MPCGTLLLLQPVFLGTLATYGTLLPAAAYVSTTCGCLPTHLSWEECCHLAGCLCILSRDLELTGQDGLQSTQWGVKRSMQRCECTGGHLDFQGACYNI
jgi:hypothetical protein